jgi:hypothetical protein
MHREGEEVHISTEEVRGAETGTGLRYMLGFGLLLAVIAMSAIWIFGAVGGEQHKPNNATVLDQQTSRPSDAASQTPRQAKDGVPQGD